MKRREFLSALGSSAILPSVPVVPKMGSETTTYGTYNGYLKGHALAIIRTKGQVSLSELMSITGLNSRQANALLDDLSRSGLVRGFRSASQVVQVIKSNWMQFKTSNIRYGVLAKKKLMDQSSASLRVDARAIEDVEKKDDAFREVHEDELDLEVAEKTAIEPPK